MNIFKTALFLLLLTACQQKVNKEQLPGRYVWNDARQDTLEIRTDGTYEYWYFLPGRKLHNSGTWQWDSTKYEIEFKRENFPFLNDHVANGSWFSPVRSNGIEIHLMYIPIENSYLQKVKTTTKQQ